MDERLVAWARAVKARAVRSGKRPVVPPLWLFTDPVRMPALLQAVGRLPPGLCGVVFRHDGVPGRAVLGRQLVRLCRARRLWLVSAPPGVPGAGRHLRGGRGAPGQWATASAHGVADLVRARRRGVRLAFLSPAFATHSHPGAGGLGPSRWGAMAACGAPMPVLALGGINHASIKRLPRRTAGTGAIGAFLP